MSDRIIQIPDDRAFYCNRHMIENIFGKFEDDRRIRTFCARCAICLMSALAIFWMASMGPARSSPTCRPVDSKGYGPT